MLESFFSYPAVLHRMRTGPIADELDAVAVHLDDEGYSRQTAKRYLSLLGTFNRYALSVGCRRQQDLDRSVLSSFLSTLPDAGSIRVQARTALGQLCRQLGWERLSQHAPRLCSETDEQLIGAFDAYLTDLRGLQPASRAGVVQITRDYLCWYRANGAGKALSDMSAADVTAFVAELARRCKTDRTRAAALSHLRGLLRYLHWDGTLERDLAALVPRVAGWRLSTIPEYLRWPQVQRVIDAVETTTAVGRRDRAMLLMLATTGIRSKELRRLTLEDIDWRAGTIHLSPSKGYRERHLPLLSEAGAALAEYVLHGRPQCGLPTLFLCAVPPARPLAHSSSVSAVVRRRLADCGIYPQRTGAHLFRHSLATRMVQQGQSVKAIADVLGHRQIDTTAIYVKVDLPQLTEVALPFPGSAS